MAEDNDEGPDFTLREPLVSSPSVHVTGTRLPGNRPYRLDPCHPRAHYIYPLIVVLVAAP